jgi:hypothetical protein
VLPRCDSQHCANDRRDSIVNQRSSCKNRELNLFHDSSELQLGIDFTVPKYRSFWCDGRVLIYNMETRRNVSEVDMSPQTKLSSFSFELVWLARKRTKLVGAKMRGNGGGESRLVNLVSPVTCRRMTTPVARNHMPTRTHSKISVRMCNSL